MNVPFIQRDADERNAARSVQKMINAIGMGPQVAEDGIVGPKTLSALNDLADDSRGLVIAFAQSRNDSVAAELDGTEIEDSEGQGARWFSKDDLAPYVRGASDRFDVSADTIWFFIRHEAIRRRDDGELFFNAHSQHGSYAGLTQMGSAAWKDALRIERSIVSKEGSKSPLTGTSYSEDKFRPDASIYAAAAYMKANLGYARYRGYTGRITKEMLYAAHNQGPQFWSSALEGKLPPYFSGQSDLAQQTIRQAVSQVSRLA